MKTLDWYLDEAKARHDIASENKLARELGLTAQSLFQWRQGRAWPKTRHMIKLAQLCDVPERDALLDLMMWSDEDGRAVWQKMADQLKNVAAVVLVVVGLGYLVPTPAHAELATNSLTSVQPEIYIMRQS